MRAPTVRPIAIAAGGTGGHFFPAEALAAALIARGQRVVLLTDARSGGLKSQVFANRETYVLPGAGASTVAELAVAGRPAILVPLPGAIDDHQTGNARALADAGGAWVMPQPSFTQANLTSRLTELLRDPAGLTRAAAAARTQARTDAAERLADLVETLMHQETHA